MTVHSDDEIVQLAQQDPKAFGVLYDKYYHQIFRFVLHRTGSEQLSKDLVSQTFLQAMVHLKKYRFQGYPFSSWLYRIATNQVNDFYRKSKKRQTVLLDRAQLEHVVEVLEVDGKPRQFASVVNVLNGLNKQDSDLLDLKFFEQLSHAEIGQIYGKSEAAIKQKVHRLLCKVRKMVNLSKVEST